MPRRVVEDAFVSELDTLSSHCESLGGGTAHALVHRVFTCLDLAPLSTSIPPAVLYLLQRLKARFPAARGSSGHRPFISAFIIASKVVCDDTYSNKSRSIVGQGMFALREVNQMEREMCSYLEWRLNIDPRALTEFEQKVRRDFKGSGPYPTSILASPAPSHVPRTMPYTQANASAPPPSFTTRVINTPSTSPPCSPRSQRCPERNRRNACHPLGGRTGGDAVQEIRGDRTGRRDFAIWVFRSPLPVSLGQDRVTNDDVFFSYWFGAHRPYEYWFE
ncbi:uncharacterized protein TRAVEDRAFT_22896 [Trametes versicolor FP-101664 SS1]|uniref:uncharacterized protein n=1 Tax=Trametes versicolor (strain FP-101664) TaxID=717944 RepID=UPI00046217EE|nr:uncharacterized protein TRAVEDRAFT_22896 [Trametes versicolor FP-101664 SS1]EIW55127.1 hypothetical protein TRAVEDRAFT_22896 [Trametes versicolor FP-101664 SS1]